MYLVTAYTVPPRRIEFSTIAMAERVAEHFERQQVDVVIKWFDNDKQPIDRYVYPLT